MGHIVKELDWATIDIALDGSLIFVRLDWMYNWKIRNGLTPWTLSERRAFHRQADIAVWGGWSKRVHVRATGTSSVAKRLSSTAIPVNFDIRWVLKKPHWTVEVTKIPRNSFKRSSVAWKNRKINLDSEDTKMRKDRQQVPVAHEFGHAIGNTVVLGRGDEYNSGHEHKTDTKAMMNVGRELRPRYFRTLIEELNKMIPGVTFSVNKV